MSTVVVDTDVVSFLFKSHSIAFQYLPDLAGQTPIIYAPFGAQVMRSGVECYTGTAASEKPLFTEQMRDGETAESTAGPGQDYFGVRQYWATPGRFTSPDPENAGADAGWLRSWNLYSYAYNNPLAYTDATGLACEPPNPETGKEKPCLERLWYEKFYQESMDWLRRAPQRVAEQWTEFKQNPNCVAAFTAAGQFAGGAYAGAESAKAGAGLGLLLGVPSGLGTLATSAAGAAAFGAAGTYVGYKAGGAIGSAVGRIVCSNGTGPSSGGGGGAGGGGGLSGAARKKLGNLRTEQGKRFVT